MNSTLPQGDRALRLSACAFLRARESIHKQAMFSCRLAARRGACMLWGAGGRRDSARTGAARTREMRYKYAKESDLSVWVFDSTIDAGTLGEIARMLEEADFRVNASRAFLDLSGVERVDLDSKKLQAFTGFNRPLLDPSIDIRVAALVVSPLAYVIVRLYEEFMADANVTFRMCKERSECAEFLQLPEDLLSPDR